MYYITMLTSLFESIALIVDQHQPIVEKYYGPGKMVAVVARLLQECDHVVKSLAGGWEEERSVKRKVWLFFSLHIQLKNTFSCFPVSSHKRPIRCFLYLTQVPANQHYRPIQRTMLTLVTSTSFFPNLLA